MIILLPLLRRLNARTRLAVGLALITVGLFLIIAALAHGVTALIVGAIFLLTVAVNRAGELLTYPSRWVGDHKLSRRPRPRSSPDRGRPWLQ